MLFVPTQPNTAALTAALTVEALLHLIAERDAEVALLRLTVDKLKLQLARRAREQYGSSSEQLTLIATEAPARVQPIAAAPTPRARPTRRPRIRTRSS